MLTIHTVDLVGCISDVLPFVTPDKDDTDRRAVHLRWDGELFHASAYSGWHSGISSWSPDDPPERDVQDELEVELGSDDAPWEFVLSVDDAKHLLKTAKPAKGLEYVPLFVEHDGQFLHVKRAKQSRVPGFSLAYDALDAEFPDLRQLVAAAGNHVEDVKEAGFNAQFLAAFAAVRQRGSYPKFTFGGAQHPTIVEIGNRFVGLIQPVRPAEDRS